MAGHDDKTEKPTPKRKKEARKNGQVPKTPDLSAWLAVLIGSLLIPHLIATTEAKLEALFAGAQDVMARPSTAGDLRLLVSALKDFASIALPTAALFMVIGVLANVAQSGLAFSLHGVKPKWNKVNPVTGIKNMLSVQSLWQLGKSVLKVAALFFVAYGTIRTMSRTLVGSDPVGMSPVLSYSGSQILGMIRDIAALGLLISVADYAYQRRRIQKALKMTKQEVKDESRNSEGDPLVKSNIRRQMYRMSRSRMMAAIAGADVIVVNPTHYSVALRYQPDKGAAPVVVAKGHDDLALRIREEGRKHQVPVVEDPPVARALYAACEVDQPIPAEMYIAVARLLAFVFTLPALVRAAGVVHRRRTSALVA